MRFLEKSGQFGGRRVSFFRIFDPALLLKGASAIHKYNDLDEYRQAILFEGHIERDLPKEMRKKGTVHLTDRRTPKAL